MSTSNAFDRAVEARLNFERAASFGAPVLRSLHPDAIRIGYSVTAQNGTDTVVESNHVLRSTLNTSEPVSFTIRTAKFWREEEDLWVLHALDHLSNVHPMYRDVPDDAQLRSQTITSLTAAERIPIEVDVDGAPTSATAFNIASEMFFALSLDAQPALVTFAGPAHVPAAGFATSIE